MQQNLTDLSIFALGVKLGPIPESQVRSTYNAVRYTRLTAFTLQGSGHQGYQDNRPGNSLGAFPVCMSTGYDESIIWAQYCHHVLNINEPYIPVMYFLAIVERFENETRLYSPQLLGIMQIRAHPTVVKRSTLKYVYMVDNINRQLNQLQSYSPMSIETPSMDQYTTQMRTMRFWMIPISRILCHSARRLLAAAGCDDGKYNLSILPSQ